MNREARAISKFNFSKKSTEGDRSEVKWTPGNMENLKIF